MPRIPIFQPEVAVTPKGPAGPLAVERDIRSSGVLELAAAKSWEGVGQAGQQLSAAGIKLDKHLTDLQDMHDLDQAKNFINQRALEYAQSAKNNPNPDDWLTSFRGDMESASEAALEGRNERVAAHLKNHITAILPSYERGLVREARQFKISSFQGNIPQSLENAVQTVVNAPDEIVAANAEAGFKGLVRTAANPEFGYLKPEEAAKWESKFDLGLKTARVNKAMRSDPAGTLAAVRKTPEVFGLTDTEVAQVLPAVTANLHRWQNDNAVEVDKLYQDKQLTSQVLKEKYDGQAINVQDFRFYDAALSSDAAPVAARTNPGVYVPFFQAAQAGKLDPDRVYNAVKAGSLTIGDMKDLIRSQEAHSRGEVPPDLSFTRDPAYKLGLQEIQVRLRPLDNNMMASVRKGLGKLAPRQEALMEHEAAHQFVEACRVAQEKGELTGPWMWQKAQEIIRPFEVLGAGRGLKGGSVSPPSPPLEKGGVKGAPGGGETITKNGRTYRVWTVGGQKMVDPNPLP